MSTFVLVHGGQHASWCWYKVIPRLERLGHTVVAVDLPGHGRDRTPLKGLTQVDNADALETVLDAVGEPVHLVAHSMGGMSATLVADRRPERVASLVFLNAVVLGEGRSMLTDPVVSAPLQNLPGGGTESDEIAFEGELANALFYSDCDEEDRALGAQLLIPEPIGCFTTPISYSAERWGRIPKFGVSGAKDALVPQETSDYLYKPAGLREIVSLPTGHSPFLSAPDLLTETLTAFATKAAAD